MAQDGLIHRLEVFMETDCTTSNKLAVMSGVDPSNFRKMLAGILTISDKTVRKICDATGLSFEWLKYDEGEMFEPDNSMRAVCEPGMEYSQIPLPSIPPEISNGIITNAGEIIKELSAIIRHQQSLIQQQSGRITQLTNKLLNL